MLDPKLLRNELDATAKKLAARGYQLDTTKLAKLETQRKEAQVRAQELQSERNSKSKNIGRAKAQGEDIQPLLDEVANLGEKLKSAEDELTSIQTSIDDIT